MHMQSADLLFLRGDNWHKNLMKTENSKWAILYLM